jgi:hypothetical protein
MPGTTPALSTTPRGLPRMPTEVHIDIFVALLGKTEKQYTDDFEADPYLRRSYDIVEIARPVIAPYIDAFPCAGSVWIANERLIIRRVAAGRAVILKHMMEALRSDFLRAHFRYCVWRALRATHESSRTFDWMLQAWNFRTQCERMMHQVRYDMRGVIAIAGVEEGTMRHEGRSRLYLI